MFDKSDEPKLMSEKLTMQYVRVPKHITLALFEENAVILDSQNGVYYGLNSASEFFQALIKLNSLDAAIEKFLILYSKSSP
ncbi:hypothetical protein MiSe_90120 [Microseira wollei NIES-4236]|uniref:Uncharacterized protein n=2 Tax=Microseira wollei TaxID=467598 RepID=A0AAV3XSQ6_9CYAN|nr:hypothetical protein MiSe_90120 [Microseira wollei NIES-4236]